MLSPYAILIGGAVALWLVQWLVTLIRRARGPLATLPGPWISKYTDLALRKHWLRGNRFRYVKQLHDKYGPIVRVSPTEVICASRDGVKQIHNYRKPFRKTAFYGLFRVNGVDNVFNTRDFDYHSQHRRLLSGPVSESSLKSVEPFIIEKVNLAIQRMGDESKIEGSADAMKWWLFMATDIIGELTFSESFRMLELGKKIQYAIDLGFVSRNGALRSEFPTLVKLASYFPVPIIKEAAAANDRLTSYAVQSLDRYEKLVEADPYNVKPTLFTKLFQAGEETMPKPALVAEARTYIIAGSDTTATTMTYLTWALCKNEGVKKKLSEEINTLPHEFDDEQLKQLPYLNQVVLEALRMYAPVPSALPREVPEGGVTMEGHFLPGGLTVSTEAYSLHRDPKIFPDPENFNPSRWESPTKEMKDVWMPFGAGPRICLGLHLAYMELRHATARLLRAYPNFKISSKQDFSDEDMEQVAYFLMTPKNKRCMIETS